MKEYVFTYQYDGYYLENGGNTVTFGEDDRVCLVVTPHQYEIQVGDRVVRSSSCDAYRIEVNHFGGACFYDSDGKTVASFEEEESTYPQCQLRFTSETLGVAFGHTETVDNYPHCDGEHDRWDTRWVTGVNKCFFFHNFLGPDFFDRFTH